MSVRFLHAPWVEASGISEIDQKENFTCKKESNGKRKFMVGTLKIEKDRKKEKENTFITQKAQTKHST